MLLEGTFPDSGAGFTILSMISSDFRGVDPAQLSPQGAAAEVERLVEVIGRHDRLYYEEAAPEIPDADYDALFRRLQDLEAAHPSLRAPYSPTQRVGGEPKQEFPNLEHAAPMLSLDSSYEPGDVRRFDQRLRKALGNEKVRYILEPKFDGVSLELVYENGILTRAVTRGNGRVGEGVTENVRTIRSVPLRLREDKRAAPPFLSVRGEVLMCLSDFHALNQRRIEAERYKNPRNATSGALRQLDSRVTSKRPLTVRTYDVLAIKGHSFESDMEAMSALKAWGLPTPDPESVKLAHSVAEIADYHRQFATTRDSLDYEIDGVVIKLDDLSLRPRLGSTSHHPRWAMAFKFEPHRKVTRIRSIRTDVARTGVLTPVAVLHPVKIGGVKVSRASLHNREELDRKDIREGDSVWIRRAGDVIPQVVERVQEEDRERGEPFRMPAKCPACGTDLVEKGPFTACPNHFGCPAQLKGRIVHFCSRNALDIRGLGEKAANLLVKEGLVKKLADLFDLQKEDLTALEGFGEASADNLVEAIQGRREVQLPRGWSPHALAPSLRRALRGRRRVRLANFVAGLGIPEVGVTVAGDLATHFRSFAAIRDATKEALEEIPGVGPKMSAAIRGFFDDPAVSTALDNLIAKGFRFSPPDGTPAGEEGRGWVGRTVVLTGVLKNMKRSEVGRALRKRGARITSAVSARTDLVVAGSKPSESKLARARELDVKVMGEEEFLDVWPPGAGVEGED